MPRIMWSFPSAFAYCNQSKTGAGEGLGMRLVKVVTSKSSGVIQGYHAYMHVFLSRCLLFHVSLPQLKSYDHHRAAEENRALTGYCLYYFNETDPHLLYDSTEDVQQKVFLSIAIITLCLAIAISVPAALYSVIQYKTGKKSASELSSMAGPSSTAKQGSTNKQNNGETSKIRQVLVRKGKEIVDEISNYMYTIIAVIIIAYILDLCLIGLNVYLLVNWNFTWFIQCFEIAFILLFIFDGICILVVVHINKGEEDRWCTYVFYFAGIFPLVIALQLLSFHGTFILLVFIFSPIPTACFTLIYISGFFSILCAVSIVIKFIHKCFIHKCCKGEIGNIALQMTVAILFAICILSLDALFFTTLVRDRPDYLGVNGFFGALVPTAIITFVSFIGNTLIKNNDSNNKDSNNKSQSTGEEEKEPLIQEVNPNDYGSTQTSDTSDTSSL